MSRESVSWVAAGHSCSPPVGRLSKGGVGGGFPLARPTKLEFSPPSALSQLNFRVDAVEHLTLLAGLLEWPNLISCREQGVSPPAQCFSCVSCFSWSKTLHSMRGDRDFGPGNTRSRGRQMAEVIYKDESYRIMGACFEVYKEMGCGFLEPVYQGVSRVPIPGPEYRLSINPSSRCGSRTGFWSRSTNPTSFVSRGSSWKSRQ